MPSYPDYPDRVEDASELPEILWQRRGTHGYTWEGGMHSSDDRFGGHQHLPGNAAGLCRRFPVHLLFRSIAFPASYFWTDAETTQEGKDGAGRYFAGLVVAYQNEPDSVPPLVAVGEMTEYGTLYECAEGWHRVNAAYIAGRKTVACYVVLLPGAEPIAAGWL